MVVVICGLALGCVRESGRRDEREEGAFKHLSSVTEGVEGEMFHVAPP